MALEEKQKIKRQADGRAKTVKSNPLGYKEVVEPLPVEHKKDGTMDVQTKPHGVLTMNICSTYPSRPVVAECAWRSHGLLAYTYLMVECSMEHKRARRDTRHHTVFHCLSNREKSVKFLS